MSTNAPETTEIPLADGDPLSLWDTAPGGAASNLPRFDTLDELLAVLDLAGDATPPVPVRSVRSAHGGVLGAQQLAQQIVLSERLAAGRTTQTLHAVFPNPSNWASPVAIDVEWLQSGRTYANLALTFRQGGRAISRADVVLAAGGPDYVRNELHTPADWTGPEAAMPVRHPMLPWETRTKAGAHPFAADLWQRIPDAPADPTVMRALLAFSTEPLIVHLTRSTHQRRATATVPDGYVTASAVMAHTITFVEEFDVREWHVLRMESTYAGHGRVTGRGEIRQADGRLCAIFECLGMLRVLAPKPGR